MNRRIITTSLAALATVAWMGAMSAPAFAFLACAVTDTGGVDDKGFNQYTWQGVQDAAKAGGFETKLLESKAETDYVPNLQSFVQAKCDVIVTVGFLLGDATKDSADGQPRASSTPSSTTPMTRRSRTCSARSTRPTRRRSSPAISPPA